MSDLHRTAQPATLASVKIWGIYGEHVVQDSPTAKLDIISILTKHFSIFYLLKNIKG